MKKALVIVLTLVLALSVVGLVSCAGKTYDGEYSYKSAWGESKYGCKVHVTVQGNVITKVTMDADTDEFYNVSAGWTNNAGHEEGVDNPGKTNWLTLRQEMLDSFVGLTVDQVLGMKVYVHKVAYAMTAWELVPVGQPVTGNDKVETIKYIPEQLAVIVGGHGDIAKDAGATQSSARLILAVQDALLQAGGDTSKNPNCVYLDMDPGVTYTGEYKYENTWAPGSYYGAKVDVTVKEGKITSVKMYTDEETGWTRTSTNWSEDRRTDENDLLFEGAEAAYKGWMDKVFVGKTVAEVKAYVAKITPKTVEGKVTGYDFAIETESANLAGATQSACRWILAVQNALAQVK